ncbi:uncharacterized protein [Aegilops tauschii subsp. strangulata]|uniref:uncharacterized protein n=1 Tax=Aegilops tauschii subsp. strangulata TaxID=200361 RepID=UPI003CC8A818
MCALFWNIRGFGHDGRRRQLIEYMRDEHIDIVAIQETMRTKFSLPELDRQSSHLFAWHWLPSSGSAGHSGGILLGVKDATFEVGSMDRWEVIIVYGPADHSRSASFLEELHRKVSAASLPVVVGGYFNLLRFTEDKSNAHVNFVLMQMFNDCIADLGLREIDRVGARFTWTNRQAAPTQSILDRVLVSPEWDLRCSLASLRAITRFAGFVDAVGVRWLEARALSQSLSRPSSTVDSWHFCAKRGRQFMKGWGANLGRDLRERKKALLSAIQALDLRADATGLSRYDLEDQLSIIYSDEEAYWRLRGAQKWVLKGDANTVYFQAITNGRRRRNTTPSSGMDRLSCSPHRTLGPTSTASIDPCSQPILGAAYLWPPTVGPFASLFPIR